MVLHCLDHCLLLYLQRSNYAGRVGTTGERRAGYTQD